MLVHVFIIYLLDIEALASGVFYQYANNTGYTVAMASVITVALEWRGRTHASLKSLSLTPIMDSGNLFLSIKNT